MALFDAMFEFSDAQDVSMAAGSVASTNILDFQAADLEMGAGEQLWLNVRVEESIAKVDGATDGGATFKVELRNDSVAPIDGSSIIVWASRAFSEAECVDGAWLVRMALPVDVDSDRILGLYYTVGAQTTAVGTVNAWIDHGPQSSYDTQVNASNI